MSYKIGSEGGSGGPHTHPATDITSAVLDVARVPTGATAATVCLGNDSRLSNARTPTSHQHSADDVNSGTLNIARLPVGSSASQVCAGNDSRLSDARTPTTHDHDTRYYTETETDVFLAAKAAISVVELAANKGAVNGYCPLGSDQKVASQYLPASSGGGWTPGWVRTGAGVRFCAAEDGNPARAVDTLLTVSNAGPTPTAVGTGVVRLIRFRLPRQLTVSALRVFYIATGVNVFSFAVYRVSDRARIFNTGLLTAPAANTWSNFAVAGSPILAADTDYWLAMGVSAVGTTNTFRSWPQVVNANVFGAANSPLADQPTVPVFAQAAVTIGATPTWPATLPVPVAAAFVNATTGTLPAVLLEGTAA